MRTRFTLAAALVAIGAFASTAQAQNTCTTTGTLPVCEDAVKLGTTTPTFVFAAGSTALGPFVRAVGQTVSKGGTTILAYAGGGSCGNLDKQIVTTGNGNTAVQGLAANTTMTYGVDGQNDANGAPLACKCTLKAKQNVDISFSDVFPTTCPNNYTDAVLDSQTAPLKQLSFAVNTFGFIAPVTNNPTTQSITFEEATLLFGSTKYSTQIAPWVNVANAFKRDKASGTQIIVGRYLGITNPDWPGGSPGIKTGDTSPSADGVLASVFAGNSAMDPSQYVGVLGYNDLLAYTNNAQLKFLAFRAKGQRYAYYPNSSPSLDDRRNVRDGRYPIWGPAHMVVAKTPSTTVQSVIDALSKEELDDQSVVKNLVKGYLTPQCAMAVTRDSDGGDLKAFAPTKPCDCLFASLNKITDTRCTKVAKTAGGACTVDADCNTGGRCLRSICEFR